jgi:acetyl esterase/lipase
MILVLLLVSLAGCRKSHFTLEDRFYLESYNKSYGTDPNQAYDLFLPEGRDENTKAIILIHGGAWVMGDKEDMHDYARYFASSGFAVTTMNYRFASSSLHYQGMLDDISSMVGCVSENSAAWGIGNGPVALFGYSAGGHLALLYTYSRDKGAKIGAVVSLAGPSDLQDSLLWKSPGLWFKIKLLAGDSLPASLMQASPVNYISPANPPTFLIHGTGDSIVPVAQSLKLNQLLRSSNSRTSMFIMENESHYFSEGARHKFLDETEYFLEENFK